MSDIQKEIKESLQAYNLRGDAQDIRIMQNNAPTWLLHQQELIEQLQREHFQICTKLGYAQKELAQKDAEIEKLNARIIYYQDLTSDPTAEELHEENKRLRQQIEYLKLTPMQKLYLSMDTISLLGKEKM